MNMFNNKVNIQMLPAGTGDCILINFIEENYNILIDGGFSDTYHNHLKKQLINLASKGSIINLLIISHIDSDHIGGILTF